MTNYSYRMRIEKEVQINFVETAHDMGYIRTGKKGANGNSSPPLLLTDMMTARAAHPAAFAAGLAALIADPVRVAALVGGDGAE